MSYQKQNFANGEVLTASQLNHIEDGIVDIESAVNENKSVVDKIIDPTLSLSGKAADAAKVGEALAEETERAKGVENQLKEDKADKTALAAIERDVMAFDRAEAAKYYRIVFHNMWDRKSATLFTNTASIGEMAFYDAAGEEVAIASAVADSELNTSRMAKHAYDRNVDTFWQSASDETAEHMLTFTLAQAAVVVRLSMMPQKYYLYNEPNEFTVYVSQDGESWQLSSTFTDQKNGWNYATWRNYDIRPYTITIPSLRTEFNSMRDNYTRVQGTELALTDAAKSRIKRLVVTPNSLMSNDATPDNVLEHGLHSGIVVTPTEGEPVSFAPELRLTCMPAPWSSLADATIGGVACAADICDWSARKLRRRFASYAFKGRESLKTFGSNPGCFANYLFKLPTTPTLTGNANNVIGLCTHYPYVPYIDIVNQTSGYGISITANPNGSHTLVVFDERFTTVEEFAAYLTEQNDAGTPVTFYYMLNPVVEEEIGAEDFERFEGFLLPGGESTVTNPDGCMLEMDYWKEFPTKNYGDWIYDLLSLKEMRAAEGSGNSGGGISLPNTVTVEEFGAVGDGLTDDTQAFVNALATGKNVLCLGESYILSDRLNIMVAGQKLTGSGHTSLKFISTDPEKVGVDMRNHYCEFSGVSLYGTGVGFGLRLGRLNPDVGDSNTKQQINNVMIYDFDIGITATSKINHTIFTNIVILRCDKAIYMTNVDPNASFIVGVIGIIFDGCLIDHCRIPYRFEASNVYFNGLNIGLTEESQCYTWYGNYVFVNSKYEANNTMVDQVVHIVNSSHVYIAHHFALGSASDSTAAFRADHGNGIVFIGCDMQTNGPESSQPTVRHFIAPDSTFNTPRAVWYGPGERTNATRLPRPILDDYPENRKYYVDFYDEVSVPAFDADTDEGKILKIVDGEAKWVTP